MAIIVRLPLLWFLVVHVQDLGANILCPEFLTLSTSVFFFINGKLSLDESEVVVKSEQTGYHDGPNVLAENLSLKIKINQHRGSITIPPFIIMAMTEFEFTINERFDVLVCMIAGIAIYSMQVKRIT